MSAAPDLSSDDPAADVDRLIAGCRSGDRDAQRALCERSLPFVYRLAVRMVGLQDAPDVTQQTFLRAFTRLDQYDGQAKFETWLYRLAVNEVLQFLRKRKRWNQPTLADKNDEPADKSQPLGADTEQRDILEQALSRLDPELRSVFLLKESESLSYRDIAEATEISEGTVGSRLNRARAELQEHLKNLGWTGEQRSDNRRGCRQC